MNEQIRNLKSGLVAQEQGEAQRMDVEGADGRGEVAGDAAARAAAAPARRAGAGRARVLHLRARLLRRPAARRARRAPGPHRGQVRLHRAHGQSHSPLSHQLYIRLGREQAYDPPII